LRACALPPAAGSSRSTAASPTAAACRSGAARRIGSIGTAVFRPEVALDHRADERIGIGAEIVVRIVDRTAVKHVRTTAERAAVGHLRLRRFLFLRRRRSDVRDYSDDEANNTVTSTD